MKILLTFLAVLFSGLVSAGPLKNIVVFGDSLSDNGNLYEYMHRQLPQSPPYYDGRFTNGLVWVEQLAKLYYPQNSNDHLLDFAFGGAGVTADDSDDDVLFTLNREIDSYLLGHQERANPDNLYVVWIGANNYLAVPDDLESAIADVNAGIEHGLKRLVDAGAKHILVVNLPDMGQIPAAKMLESEEVLSQSSNLHNEKLSALVSNMKKDFKQVQWLYYDVQATMQKMFDSPETYGFNNTSETCYDGVIDKPSNQSILKMATTLKTQANTTNCEGFLFFDLVHPSAAAHLFLAQDIRALLDREGVEFK